MQVSSDRELVRHTLRGDADSFAALVERYFASVFALSYGRLLHHADAEDVTQDTFLRAYEKLGQLREPDRFESWVHRIAMTLAYDRFRTRARETPLDPRELLRDTPAESDEHDAFEREADAARTMAPALRILPEHLRVAFVMFHRTGVSYVTLARRLHISPVAAERRVQRAWDRLRGYFRRQERGRPIDSLVPVAPMGDALLARIDQTWRQGAPPTPCSMQATASPHGLGLVAAGVAATMLVFAGAYGAYRSHVRWGDLRRDGNARYVELASAVASAPTADGSSARQLIVPGEELRGWIALEPGGDTALPTRAGTHSPAGGDVAVVDNDFGVYKAIPPIHGEVELDVLIRAPSVGTNGTLGFMSRAGATGPARKLEILHRMDTDTWSHAVHGSDPVPFVPADGAWRRVGITYNTHTATYHLDVDGRRVASNVQAGPAYAGVAVHGVRMHSGRGGVGAPMDFADMRLSVANVESRQLVRAPVRAVKPPERTKDRVIVRSARIGGLSLALGMPMYTAYPGERIQGSVSLGVTNGHGPSAEVYLVEAATWSDRRRGYRTVADLVRPGESELHVEIDRIAPDVPGAYYLVFASSAETSGEFVASGTNWSNDRAGWGDDTDVAAWPEARPTRSNGKRLRAGAVDRR